IICCITFFATDLGDSNCLWLLKLFFILHIYNLFWQVRERQARTSTSSRRRRVSHGEEAMYYWALCGNYIACANNAIIVIKFKYIHPFSSSSKIHMCLCV
ncbi:hypothetical protein ACJX0J_033161, partial [Zea mays]